jgi:hypothetical protein
VERIVATARGDWDGGYVRKGHADERTEAAVQGLGAGTFSVRVHVTTSGPRGDERTDSVERVVTVDGVLPARLDVAVP